MAERTMLIGNHTYVAKDRRRKGYQIPLLAAYRRLLGKTGNNVGVYYFMIMLCGLRLRASITALLNTQ